ncbi:MAG TPA: DUF2203 domain-containing protein [Tepidisphaeraceae bacterium]|nr:DUF2203 domain-containing protein [Tepidisphaeraceae bacterium]
MAAPQFFTPPRVTPSRPKRRFSLEQANRTLPLVGRIVADIVQTHKNATTLQSTLEKTQASSQNRAGLERELETTMERLHALLDELYNVGCEIKDFQSGLIDFIGRHQGRDVYLCWKPGEDKIQYWHELDAGFTGRQPISTLQEKE